MGAEKVISSVPADVEIVVDVIGGDCVIEGKPAAEVKARGDNPRVEASGNQVLISCGGDCRVQVPDTASVTIATIGGDGKITLVRGAVRIASAGGDVVLRELESVDVGHVGGDLKAKHITGSVQVDKVDGDAHFHEIGGDVRAAKLGGDVLIEHVDGNCLIQSIDSDLVLDVDFRVGMQYQFDVSGDVLGKIAPDANVEFVVPQHTEVEIHTPGAQMRDEHDQTIITFGAGQAHVVFESIDGDMELVREGKHSAEFTIETPDDIDEIINGHIAEHLAHLQEAIAHKTEQIHEQVRAATERVEQEAEKIVKAKRRAIEFNWSWPERPDKPKRGSRIDWDEKSKRHEPVSNKERLEILRMVENKQISVEEAERLLSALEGSD